MVDSKALRDRKPQEVRAEIERLLAADLSDGDLRTRLEELAEARAFDGFTWLWGPVLYRRDRVVFRPFILGRFSTFLVKPGGRWESVAWKTAAPALDAWLDEVDAADDVELFKRLYPWKHSTSAWQALDEARWRADVRERFRQAASRPARAIVLSKFDIPARLDEATALALYRIDRHAAGDFILRHLEGVWGETRKLWTSLFDEAHAQHDGAFAFKLYRRQISAEEWEDEILELLETIEDADELCAQLDLRHPEGWGRPLGKTFHRLVQARGRDVLPYVRKHLRSVYRSWWGGRDGYAALVKLAAQQQWWDLWSALVRTCAKPEEFNAEVRELLKVSSGAADVRQRLLMLTGVSREWNFGPFGLAQVQQLDDATAVRLYALFPDLVRGPFKMNVSAGWHGTLPKLTEAAIAAGDEILIDYLASRAVTRAVWPGGWGADQVAVAERLSRYYEQFENDDAEFARRAAGALGQVPAYTVGNYNQLVRTNRLARMLYERSAPKYLAHPAGLRELLESPEIHSQALAFRVLGLADEQARRLAAANVDLLEAALLRPLHRRTRLLAFRALENAADDVETARRIERRCREALSLPDKRYPKEQLIGLIGRLLHRWPDLSSPRERPVVYGASA